jgi:outer membrane receptor protein involved in Fe transport
MQHTVIRIILTLTTVLTQFAFGTDFMIRGKISDAQTQTALPDANISIAGTSLGTISDDTGQFFLQIQHPGNYILQVNYIGYQKYRQALKLTSNRVVEVNIALVPDVIFGEDVTVTAKADANRALARKTPVAFSNLDLLQIRNNYTTGDLPELIQNVPGVWTSSAGLGESEILVRGFTSDKVRFMLNDLPMNEPEDNQVYWSNWASLSGTANSIEVHRGPGFSLYGPAAFGGSVHIETMGVGSIPGSTVRFSTGIYRRMGIDQGSVTGKVFNPDVPDELYDAESAVNYTYSVRMNSGPKLNGKLNVSAFLEYKTGDSYI